MANFKTRARALDLLGRQQIAGIPTAINELLKNAHDAYADNVDIDYLRVDNVFILRDDGIGMSREDFESRWLTLGTESKLNHTKATPPPVDHTKPKRIAMGEKGIGRLAIASIGNQVLIVTKAKNKESVTAALINWQIFELPGLNLEDISIPIRSLNKLPTETDIHSMKLELLGSLQKLLDVGQISVTECDEISTTINSFTITPETISNRLLRSNSFEELESGGTHFYVSPVDETLKFDLDGASSAKEATKIEKMLMGFHNTMTPDHPDPILDIVFRDYRSDDGSYVEVINKEEFFTQNEFELADHHFKGQFDEYGQFKGTIKVYNEETFDHIVNWNGNNFNQTRCGSFEINLAYVQGNKRHSIINDEDYARIFAKSEKFGGLYVYKDNIRILPYGNSDVDYLDVEKRRSKHAGLAFFSYRRMFGVINLKNNTNFRLKEKAGREGFIEDKAYRQFREILINFFTQLAADFFRDDSSAGPKADVWAAKRAELESTHKALEKRNKQAKAKKEKFVKALNSFFENLQKGIIKQDIESIGIESEQALNTVYTIKDHDLASQKILDTEASTRQKLQDYRKSIAVPAPRGFLVRGDLKQDYEMYLEEMTVIESTSFKDVYQKLDNLVEETVQKLEISISKRKRLEQAVDFISSEAKAINVEKKKFATDSAIEIGKRVKALTSELMIDLDDQIREVKDKFKTIPIDNESDLDLVTTRNELSEEITSVSERNTDILDTIIRQLEGIYWEKDEENNYITSEQITNALGEELDELREKVHTDVELSQLGLAVSIIHHEFNSTVRSVRASLKDLKAWSDVNENLEGVYKNIKVNFEHLDGYLNLFTPLNRRLTRHKEDIKLLEIKAFLKDLFGNRFARHEIGFKHTNGFAKAQITGFRSSFYPVFVNVIDNAIHWLNESNVADKVIRLHAEPDGTVYISNNGIEIPIQDKHKIFQLGFSRKANGRGMGLHISNEVLANAGYELCLVEPRKNATVTFKISRMEKDSE